ncbi:hypothetical protein CH380_07875 [Leptospira adleri]|uniref:Uncharacterized protein n=1 Tax=Leptospira adleri TaxID=2023186 RepID=A0A2M9YQT9_9LEPT|nr:hypothetical protein CH380_07875 [Leptospira adleri]PJZ59531.1 hypothetical protein CH376_23250 [Leptospira adleri]
MNLLYFENFMNRLLLFPDCGRFRTFLNITKINYKNFFKTIRTYFKNGGLILLSILILGNNEHRPVCRSLKDFIL